SPSRLAFVPRRHAGGASGTAGHGDGCARHDAVFRRVLRRREHPPLFHGLRDLAPGQPRYAISTRGLTKSARWRSLLFSRFHAESAYPAELATHESRTRNFGEELGTDLVARHLKSRPGREGAHLDVVDDAKHLVFAAMNANNAISLALNLN